MRYIVAIAMLNLSMIGVVSERGAHQPICYYCTRPVKIKSVVTVVETRYGLQRYHEACYRLKKQLRLRLVNDQHQRAGIPEKKEKMNE